MKIAFLLLVGLSQDPVPDLVRELDAAPPGAVWEAAAKLEALGPAALPAIDAAAKRAEGRLRDYLGIVAAEIRNPTFPVRRVTLRATQRPSAEVMGLLVGHGRQL